MDQQDKVFFRPVRGFLFRLLNKEFLIFLFFLALSGIFWLATALNDTLEKEFSIPVVVGNVPEDVYITNAKDSTNIIDTLKVTLRDKGYTLASYYYGKGLHPITINYNSVKNVSSGHFEYVAADLKRMLRQQLDNSTEIVTMKPERVEVNFSHDQKEVRVLFSGKVSAAQNYFVADTIIAPQNVTLYANSATREAVSSVKTEYVSFKSVEDTVTREVRLIAPAGARLKPDKVSVSVVVDVLQELTAEVPVTAINVPDNYSLRIYPPKARVKYVIGSKMAKRLKDTDIKVYTDYRTIGTGSKCKLYVTCGNPNVKGLTLEEDSARYLIQQ